MQAYPKYDSYKASGVDSLGDIPSHWVVKRFRNLFSFSKGLTITKEDLHDSGIPCVNYGEIHSRCGFEVDPSVHDLKCVDASYLKRSPKSLLCKGDFIFADTSEDIEGSGNFTQFISDETVFAGSHTVVARTSEGNNRRFLAYAIDSIPFRTQIRRSVKGVKVYSITQSILKATSLWLPSREEQARIGNFLDLKTREIDETIAKKQQLIKLLNEQKVILINQAVTKGLNPHAPMRDSGVEWIGDIPEHWGIKKNRELFEERKEPGRDELPILSVSLHTGVSTEQQSSEENLRAKIRIEDKSSYKLVEVGDVAFNMMRAWQGAIGVVKVLGMVSPAYIVAKPKADFNGEYFEYLYRTDKFIGEMDRYSKGITDFRKRLYWDEFKQLNTIVPPVYEQEEISVYIKKLNDNYDNLITSFNQEIGVLGEYRRTLIANAVTGKIKV